MKTLKTIVLSALLLTTFILILDFGFNAVERAKQRQKEHLSIKHGIELKDIKEHNGIYYTEDHQILN